jgi:hypothetical protein
MSTGKTVQIIGAVVDVEFPRDSIPEIYDALKIGEAALRWRSSSSWATAWCGPSPWDPPKGSSAV